MREDIGGVGVICALENGGKHGGEHGFELVVVNAPEVGAIGILEDRVGDVGANFCGDGLGGDFFCTDDSLVDEIQAVGFVLCI